MLNLGPGQRIRATKIHMGMKKLLLLCLIFGLSQVEIKAQELTMFSGFLNYQYYQDDKKISRKKFVSLLEKDIVAFDHWKKSKTFNTLSLVALASEAGFAAWEITDNNDPSNDTVTKIGVYGSFAAVIAFGILSHSQKKKATLKYNQGLDNSNAFSIKPSKMGWGS